MFFFLLFSRFLESNFNVKEARFLNINWVTKIRLEYISLIDILYYIQEIFWEKQTFFPLVSEKFRSKTPYFWNIFQKLSLLLPENCTSSILFFWFEIWPFPSWDVKTDRFRSYQSVTLKNLIPNLFWRLVEEVK